MPLYVYECAKGHRGEAWQSIKDDALRTCIAPNRRCFQPARRIIVPPGGYVMEPSGIYQPLPGMDPKTKRGREEKISKREYERRDREHRDRMLAISKGGPRLDLEPPKRHTWF